MRYDYVKPDRKRGVIHWGHRIHLYCSRERLEQLQTFLNTVVGPHAWVLASSWDQAEDAPTDVKPTMDVLLENTRKALVDSVQRAFAENATVMFANKNHAMCLKLMWLECEPIDAYVQVILPLIRRVMPSVMANEIIGVAPMTGPHSSIFSLRAKYK